MKNDMHPAGVPETNIMPSTYLSLHYHLVFSTKDRTPLIEASWRNRLMSTSVAPSRDLKDSHRESAVRPTMFTSWSALKATHCLADFMRELKKASSVWAHDEIGIRAFA
jgi:hypothetical protein